ncbi:DUF58 domain-containing protein [Candidatus Protochlamydia amoebophila]|uniref:DUF58 domain-containing protein n=1 Tax=Protochlamydia amoebophila (strain UWE25) TaxID=264201 RepID=Q6M9Z2_PARUW|nr:DUF58 domain-containing protein [Candidatus Protochlamydia amoebophila]CAF24607.1 unnamed protein product [Candidatus Protochlamydia amoebophila UWE25]
MNPTLLEIFQHIRRIQIETTRNVDDLFAGIYRSAFKGRGLEFEDVREYQPGDDIRSIDWNVTARLQTPYLKNFREERELTVMLVVDISASSHFSHIKQLKSELIAEVAALLAFSAIKNQDNVGLLLFSNQIELYLKPKKGLRHVLRVIRELLFFQPQYRGTDLQKALRFLGNVQKKQSTCFLISDFLTQPLFHAIHVTAKRHELIGIQLYDEYEQNFPSMGLISLYDLESNKKALIDSSDKSLQKFYQESSKYRQQLWQKTFAKAGAAWISIRTDESSTQALYNFFKFRHKK